MMREILGVAQDGTGVQRRWFHDDYFDLFVWQTDQEITAFQLCYGLDTSERALEWSKDHGWFQDGKTAAEPLRRRILGKVLAPARPADADPPESIAPRFESAARDLPDVIRTGVATRLREFAGQETVTARRTKVRRAAWQKNVIPGSG